MRRRSPASVSTRSTSYTAWWETAGSTCRAVRSTASVSACGWSCTAPSTATRGRVTRSEASRSSCWSSSSVTTDRSLATDLESVKKDRGPWAAPLVRGQPQQTVRGVAGLPGADAERRERLEVVGGLLVALDAVDEPATAGVEVHEEH